MAIASIILDLWTKEGGWWSFKAPGILKAPRQKMMVIVIVIMMMVVVVGDCDNNDGGGNW